MACAVLLDDRMAPRRTLGHRSPLQGRRQIGRSTEEMTMEARLPHFRHGRFGGLVLLAVMSIAPAVHAQIAVSSNDNKVVNVDGVNKMVENPAPDNITIIDLGTSPPKIIGQLDVPGSVVGPP